MSKTYLYESNGVTFMSDLPIEESEAEQYIKRGKDKYGNYLRVINAHVDGDFIELTYALEDAPKFDRIRRITGYLTSVDRFNDAKTAELKDRVKHGIS